jgi:hypothetical protein
MQVPLLVSVPFVLKWIPNIGATPPIASPPSGIIINVFISAEQTLIQACIQLLM